MLDIQFIRENAELVQRKSEEKGYKVSVAELLELDTERRSKLTQIEELRSRRNKLPAYKLDGDQAEFDARIAEGKQRAQAHTLIAAAKADAARATQAALDAAAARIEEATAAAQARIAAARAAAEGEVQDVAAQAAQDIVSRLAGLAVSAEDARGAVQGVLAHG